ncbi:MAG: sugar phosphate isomerase/epimerase [Planctomycetaceae bacterium]|jgi:hexulose-6-phosphate isomerase|nr:sugar phosphate isomerase/epimerase [Planctomycetaceae bacterium]
MTVSRREFFGAAAAATISATYFLSNRQRIFADEIAQPFSTKIYKARITQSPTPQYCESLKEAGFAGMEVSIMGRDASIAEARRVRQLVESYDLRIHSVLYGWANFNIANKYESDLKSVKSALQIASAYGADTLLLVTCNVGKMGGDGYPKKPEAWGFDVDFDPVTLKVKTVAEGDNKPYADYIAAQNHATETSIRAVESLIPTAAREGVRIGLENVWNNLWCTPKFFAAFCKYFKNAWVGSYLDLGNHTKYSRCEEWIKELSDSIIKLHIKGYKVKEVKGKLGGGPGDWTAIDKGSIDWKSVRKSLNEVRYNGWISVEEDLYNDKEYSKILDKFIAGE